MNTEAPRKKKQNAIGPLVLAALALLFLILTGKKPPPPGPRAILRSVGEPDISPAGTISRGDTKAIAWQCANTGDGDGLAVLRVDIVGPVPSTGIHLGVSVPVLAGQIVSLALAKPYDLLPGDYTMRVVMLDSTTVALPQVDSREFPLSIRTAAPVAILTAGTLEII